MKKVGYVVIVLIAIAVVGHFLPSDDQDGRSGAATTPAGRHYTELLDEALYNVGYVAGMSSGHRNWPQVSTYVGREGQYTRALLLMRRPGVGDDLAATMNVNRYEAGRDDGSAHAFDETDALARTQRVRDIIEREMIPAMEAAFR